MTLLDKILSSRVQSAAVSVQPYKAVTPISAYGNRNLSAVTGIPPVADARWTNAKPVDLNRDKQLTYSSPIPVLLRTGAAPTNGNNAPNRRGV